MPRQGRRQWLARCATGTNPDLEQGGWVAGNAYMAVLLGVGWYAVSRGRWDATANGGGDRTAADGGGDGRRTSVAVAD